MFKRIILCLSFVIFCFTIVDARAALCPCGGQIHISKEVIDTNIKEIDCVHGYSYGTDLAYYNVIYETKKCDKCQQGCSRTYEEFDHYDCHGYEPKNN